MRFLLLLVVFLVASAGARELTDSVDNCGAGKAVTGCVDPVSYCVENGLMHTQLRAWCPGTQTIVLNGVPTVVEKATILWEQFCPYPRGKIKHGYRVDVVC